jgi:AAA15 family ATPase/GTPase
MKLTFVKSHKSITSLPNIELSDFVVLTGVNGAGKTHLLEAIENGAVQIDNIILNNQTKPIRLFNWSNLVPNDTGAFAPYQITQEIYGLWNEISQNIISYRSQVTNTLMQLEKFDLLSTDISKVVSMTEADLMATGCSLNKAKQIFQAIQNIAINANENIASNFARNDSNRKRFIDLLKEKSKTPLIAFEEDDFYENYPRNWRPIAIFQQSLARLFAEYQKSWLSNQFKAFQNSKGEPVKFLSDEEFLAQYGEPPWDFLNSVLEAANIDFRINQPAKYEDRPYEPILTEQIRGTQVKFADLSSGERILMSFALCLYYAEDRQQIIDYPQVLLFDEIDAPLHPSMTQSLLNTIQEVLINRHGIKVILTTHSPSTVALAPAESLYVMKKLDQQRLQKIKKDKALTILTTGVPTLSIDYENRRQVFVESHYDVEIYERIYEKLKNKLIAEISINFISSGVGGKGNCDQVKEVVNQLYKHGNRTTYGIIDWDLKNNENERVKVLGHGNRYSIENYILDPVLVVAFLLREKFIDRSTVGLSNDFTYIHLAKLDNIQLQQLADFIVTQVRVCLQPQTGGESSFCEYIGGQKVGVPKWFLKTQGHQLEKSLKESFPKLKRFQKENELKSEIILKVIDDIPAFIPKDFVLLFQKIQGFDV